MVFKLSLLIKFSSNNMSEYRFCAIFLGDYYGLIATRVILGLVQGPTFPCLSAFVVPWYPVEQRGRLCSIGYIGISVFKKKIIWCSHHLKSKFVANFASFFVNNFCTNAIRFTLKAGGAFASFISGLLIHHFGRWDIVFYFFTAVLVLLWILFVSFVISSANHCVKVI